MNRTSQVQPCNAEQVDVSRLCGTRTQEAHAGQPNSKGTAHEASAFYLPNATAAIACLAISPGLHGSMRLIHQTNNVTCLEQPQESVLQAINQQNSRL